MDLARTKAIASRFAVGTLITELPIVSVALAHVDSFDPRLLLLGLAGGLALAVDKYLTPALVPLLEDGTLAPVVAVAQGRVTPVQAPVQASDDPAVLRAEIARLNKVVDQLQPRATSTSATPISTASTT